MGVREEKIGRNKTQKPSFGPHLPTSRLRNEVTKA